jgi:hypothetical protein
MSNAITNNAAATTRTSGIGSALRCVAVVGREALHRQALKRPAHLRDDLLQSQFASHDSAKRLDAAHAPAAGPFAGHEPASTAALALPRPASADMYLPPAAWASLVVVRAVSA